MVPEALIRFSYNVSFGVIQETVGTARKTINGAAAATPKEPAAKSSAATRFNNKIKPQ